MTDTERPPQATVNEALLTLNHVDEWLKQNNLPALHISYRASTWTVILSSSEHVSYTAISPRLCAAWEAVSHSYEMQSTHAATIRLKMDKALQSSDARQLSTLVEEMRLRGWRYMDIVRFAQSCQPSLTLAEWETLMQEADEEG